MFILLYECASHDNAVICLRVLTHIYTAPCPSSSLVFYIVFSTPYPITGAHVTKNNPLSYNYWTLLPIHFSTNYTRAQLAAAIKQTQTHTSTSLSHSFLNVEMQMSSLERKRHLDDESESDSPK